MLPKPNLPHANLRQTQGKQDLRLYRLVYSSHACGEVTDAEALAIFRRGRTNNDEEGITGCLVFSAGQFSQVIEGPRAKIEALITKIRNDERHNRIEVLWAGYADKRLFSNFSLRSKEAIAE